MQTFNPTGTADLEVLFYLPGWWKWHILVGRFYYEWQHNGIKMEESDLDDKRSGRGTVKLKSRGRAELLTGICRGGELHTENPEEWVQPHQKAGVCEWNSGSSGRGQVANKCRILRLTYKDVYLFSGQSRYFHISS